MIKLITILNELKLNDLVGNQYKYVIGSSEEKHIGENDKKYVLEMIEKSLKTYLYDDDFALNYLDGSQRKEYNSFFEREVLTPMLKKVDFTLNNFFVLDGDKVKWKLSSNDTRKMVDEIFRKNSKVPSDIKKEYYEYRLEYAGVKLKEGVNDSELKGYLIADVVDDIIKAIGPRLVSGEIKQSDRNKIYLKLTDVKVGSGVVKLLKSKFGIDAKEEMFGGKDKFGSIPSVSFFANKVINEELYKVAGKPVTLIKGKKSDATDWKVKFQNGKETSLSDVLALIKPFPKGVHWRYKNLESVNEAKPAVVGNVNAFGPSKVLGKGGKVLGFVPDTPNAIATLIQDYPNVQAIEFKSPFFFDFNSYKSIKKGDKAWKELMSRGVDKATKAALKKDFQLKESVNEAKVKTPDFIVTSIPADAIPSTNISKADVGLGLSMFDALGRGWTLNNKDYKLDYHNGKVVLKLTSSGKTAVRVKSGHDPKYVQKIEKFANDYLSKYAKEIKK
jgi:hypothetical protein